MRLVIWAAILAAFFLTPSLAQHDHAAGHNEYQNWSSQLGTCCNNQDCRALEWDEWRETGGGTEVLIDGSWCPVTERHFLVRGKSPNWDAAHACVRQPMRWLKDPPQDPCSRLMCFTGVPRT